MAQTATAGRGRVPVPPGAPVPGPATAEPAEPIPRIIHSIWVGGAVPAEHRRYLATWQHHHPGWRHRHWTEADIEAELYPMGLQPIYDRASWWAPGHEGQLRADVVRYEILHRIGGLYVDTDLECLQPVDELLEGQGLVAAREDDHFINNAFMAARPGHPFMANLLENVGGWMMQHKAPGVRPNVLTGPHFLTQMVAEYRPADLRILPAELIYPYRWDQLERGSDTFQGAYTVHHWANARRRRGIACP